ncbi:immunoglobulin-like and fibronectin type III domain-containing protein 1 [Carassius gibelio]|uniref:immunoglobulin-like and fibronectin type III domain-containing protein 1 n=1 Tax=Carassius gibelio TaxID=101364 RepID=UPI0022782196|nr:immunoglobulin-like and fibronectin type III domain-containing protein 1 [Carassius gibelio]
MITQYVKELPRGKSTPDFTRKPIALTVQEGKVAIFKAVVSGDPAPTVTWARNKGDTSDPEKYKPRYDERNREHVLEIANVQVDQADTYKCFATNQFGKAMCTAALSVFAVGFKKKSKDTSTKDDQSNDPEDFRKMLRKTTIVKKRKEKPKKEGEIDPKFWEVMLSAKKSDYERICHEFGVTDYRWMLKQLNLKRKEKEDEQAKVVEDVGNMKPIEVKTSGRAEFEFDMKLKDTNSKIYLFKDGHMLDYGSDTDDSSKHHMKKTGDKYMFSINNLGLNDGGLYQVDVDDVNIISTTLAIPDVEFDGILKDAKVVEGKDAMFEGIFSGPVPQITWCVNDISVEHGDKYNITVSEDKLTHRLVVKNCKKEDKGVYTAIAGIKSSRATLAVDVMEQMFLQDIWQMNRPDCKEKKKKQPGEARGQMGEVMERMTVVVQRMVVVMEWMAMVVQRMVVVMERMAMVVQRMVVVMERMAMVVQRMVVVMERIAMVVQRMVVVMERMAMVVQWMVVVMEWMAVEDLEEEKDLEEMQQESMDKVALEDLTEVEGIDLEKMRQGNTDKEEMEVGVLERFLEWVWEQTDLEASQLWLDLVVMVQVHFASGLTDTNALRGKPADLVCKLNTDKIDGVWYKDGNKLASKDGVVISKDGCTHKLIIQNCKDSDVGLYHFEVNGCKTEATVRVGDLPEFDPDALQKFSNPVIVKAGQSASFKMSFPPQASLEIKWFKNGSELLDGGSVKVVKELNHSRLQIKDCLRSDSGQIKIQLKNPFGSIEALSSLIVLDKPGPPQGPLEVTESTSSVLELKWNPPKDEGGSEVTNYIIERQQVGQGAWKRVGDISANHLTFRDRNVSLGKRYIYRIYAENLEGVSEAMETEKIMAGSLMFPGPPGMPKVVSAFKNCINLIWTPPEKYGGNKILGYQLEKRKKDTNQWVTLNPVKDPIQDLKYAVKDVSEGSEYEFRVTAINMSGPGEPSAPSVMVCAKNPNTKPHFKDPEDFMVVRSGNSIRIRMNYEASPPPDITWLKNGEPVSPWNKIIHADGTCTLVIPSSKYSDSGVYTIVAKNSSGQASFDIDVRVTDEPKPPGPVELEQVVYGKVIITWSPSPDHNKDDRLHYMLEEYNSNTRIWRRIADHLLCTTYTTSIQPGQEYHFRVYAKNDMGVSDASESPTWGKNNNKVPLSSSVSAVVTLERPPSVLVPLKLHTPPKGYQCYMTCAVRGCPSPYIAWYHNGICINSDNNYYITNASGICSMYILRVRPEDSGEYKVVAVNPFGKAECSSTLKVKDDPSVHEKDDGVDELGRRLADEKARLQKEQDEAAMRAQSEKDEAARRSQDERDEAVRKAQIEKDEAAKKAQAERDEAARRAQAERDEAARRAKAQ